MNKHIKNNVTWVGKVDWELKSFHGEELSTHKGSTYNSYLIKEGKNVLIDTVWMPYAKEFVENLAEEIDLNDIDFIMANHGEVDHSGALPELMKHIPDTPIYCTENGIKSLKGQYHQDWNFVPVKTGDKIDIGNGKELIFVEMKMLHWQDSMAVYMTSDNILFSNDAFGQHLATESLFNDTVDQCELYNEGIKYFANILAPYCQQLTKKIEEIVALNLPVDIIATSHGAIWRDNPGQIIEQYAKWSDAYQENQITVFYATMWEGTKKMAEAIVRGIESEDSQVTVKMYNTAKTDRNDLITEIFKSKTIVVGSPTMNNSMLGEIAGLLDEIKGMKLKNKKAASFGCYGWSGQAVKMIDEELEKSGFEVIEPGLKNLWNPDKYAVEKCIELGKKIARS